MHTFDLREYVDSCRHYFTRGYHDTDIFSSEPQLKRTSNETKGVKYQFLPNMVNDTKLVPLSQLNTLFIGHKKGVHELSNERQICRVLPTPSSHFLF